MKEKQHQKTSNSKLKILVVIHGFPPYYMAGSEVYTFHKCRELSKNHDLTVFTRIEDEFERPYTIRESFEYGFRVIRVNKPSRDYTFRSKYNDDKMARIFQDYLDDLEPDVVHIDHLSHLTTQIIDIIEKKGIPIVITLHDYWMICIKGQLINEENQLCSGPSLEKCARCNAKYFNSQTSAIIEVESWIEKMKEINLKVDKFIAPSKFLKEIYVNNGIPNNKIIYADYGFDKTLIKGINSEINHSGKIRFGYTGRIIPVKGIALLIDAFNQVDHSNAELNVYGRLPSSLSYLKARMLNSAITLKGGYTYDSLDTVLSNIDVLVVPSLWYENSPLVIHEAFLARIPVIASNMGGMAELITHKKNGLLFEPGNVDDLIDKMNIFIQIPSLMQLYSQKTKVRSIQEDVGEILRIYKNLLKKEEINQIVS